MKIIDKLVHKLFDGYKPKKKEEYQYKHYKLIIIPNKKNAKKKIN